MPNICKVCTHPRLQEINADIISQRISMRQIAIKYRTKEHNVSYSGVRYHKDKHLSEAIKAVKEKRVVETGDTVIDTLDAYNKIINQLPEVIESATLNTIIRALEGRARILGEEHRAPRIIIEWGLPFDKEYFARIQSQYVDMKGLPEPLTLVEPEYTVEDLEDLDEEELQIV